MTTTRLIRTAGVAVMLATAMAHGWQPAVAQSQLACGTDMKILVIAADGTEADLPAITSALSYIGIPHEVYVATQHPGGLTAAKLSSGCHAFYQGVILTTAGLAYPPAWQSALTAAEFETLRAYEASFGVRQVTWYAWPTQELGFSDAFTASGSPLTASLTAAGAQLFPYLNSAAAIPIQYSWTYLGTPLTDGATTPLLTDDQGHTLAAVRNYPDGRANLAMTFDSNQYLTHAMVLSYGVINWVTDGLFIGDRHVYMSPQVDDVFIDNTHWSAASAIAEGTACGTPVDSTGGEVRMTATDLAGVVAWQQLRRLDPLTPNLRLTMAFNGVGTTGIYPGDTLTAAARRNQSQFHWVSHTWDHESLDAPMDYAGATFELTQNNTLAAQMGLRSYSVMNLVQPNVSGLAHPPFLQAAYDNGVRYLVTDTSKPGQDNPAPNIGIWNPIQPQIFEIPRRANNLFFNVVTPADWVAEYNCMYRAYWGEDKTYAQVLDLISQELLAHLLRGELDPWMFHQPNLISYDGAHTLLTDLLNTTLEKYRGYFALPILTPPMNEIGARMASRTVAYTYGVTGTIQPGKGVVLSSPVEVTIPVTGLKTLRAESYGGQWITWVTLKANQPTFVPMADTPGVKPPVVSAGPAQTTISLVPVTLTGTASDPNEPARPLTFAWTQTSGPVVTLTGADSLVASFVAPILPKGANSALLGFALTAANDVLSSTSTTTVRVDAPKPPIADAGTSQTVNWNTSVTLAGTGTDPNVPALPLTFEWIQTSGTPVALEDPHQSVTSFTAPNLPVGASNVTLRFTLRVSNGATTATSSTSVTVRAPRAPVVNAGAAQTVPSGASVTLTGTASDPNQPPLPLTYQWRQTAGPGVALSGATTAIASFTAPTLAPGAKSVKLGFSLAANNGLATTTGTTTVTVTAPPRLTGNSQGRR